MKLKKGDIVYVEFTSESRTEFSGNIFKGVGVLDRVEDGYLYGTTTDGRHFMCNEDDVKKEYSNECN